MRAAVFVLFVAIGLVAHPVFAQTELTATTFWNRVQAACDATAAKPPSALGRRIALAAIDEFVEFGGHRIDSTGRLFHFGRTEAEHGKDDGDIRPTRVGQLAWWRVLNYWRALYENDPADKLEILGYRDAVTSTLDTQATALVRSSTARLLHIAEGVADPTEREILREAAYRMAIIDTPWSAAFISYVIRQSGVSARAFHFSNAHRTYIYEAFSTSAAELNATAGDQLYRACPITTTRPRLGDLICDQREPTLANAGEAAVRERIRAELGGGTDIRSIRQTHCEIVAHIDAPARKMYTIGGNVQDAVTAKKLSLRGRDLKLSATQPGQCGNAGHWTLPHGSIDAPRAPRLTEKCSLNDKKWFVLLQVR